MDIEYGMLVVDKNGKSLGKVSNIVLDGWSGEPRKFVVRPENEVSAFFFSPEQVAEVSGEKVKLNLAAGEVEQT
jgi:sporulation protein YlmC with PRC-barrel domain